METKEKTTPNLSQFPKAKAEFDIFKDGYFKQMDSVILYEAQIALRLITRFYLLPFDFQSGVYLAFLREKGIYANAEQYDDGLFIARCVWYKPEFDSVGKFPIVPNNHTALIQAIEAGFARVETT